MKPDLFKPLFDFADLPYIGAYFTVLAFSFSLSFPITFFFVRRYNLGMKMLLVPLGAIPGSLLFSKIFHVLFDGQFWNYMNILYKKGFIIFIIESFNPFKAGHVFYGGLLGGFIFAAVITKIIYKNDYYKFMRTADVAAFVVIFGLALTRIGCFLEGCCYGIQAGVLGVRYPAMSLASFELYSKGTMDSYMDLTPALLPTQLIESAGAFIIFFYLLYKLKIWENIYAGYYAEKTLLMYSIMRFTIEFFRYDQRGELFFLSTSQWISIIVLVVLFSINKPPRFFK